MNNTITIKKSHRGKWYKDQIKDTDGFGGNTDLFTSIGEDGRYMLGEIDTEGKVADISKENRKKIEGGLGVKILTSKPADPAVYNYLSTPQAKLSLKNKTTQLNLDKPLDLLRYLIALGSPYVANSFADFTDNVNPLAQHYIVDTIADEKDKISLIEKKQFVRKAIDKSSIVEINDLIIAIMNENASKISNDRRTILSEELIDDNLDKTNDILQFGKNRIRATSLFVRGIWSNVIVKAPNGDYFYADQNLGEENASIATFESKENSELTQRIEAEIKEKEKKA